MSELIVITRPELLDGYRLAGVEAYAASDPAGAEEHLRSLLNSGRGGLAAIDADLFEGLKPELVHRMRKSRDLFHVVIPGKTVDEGESVQEQRLLAMIRRAIGFQVSFGEEEQTEP